MRLDLGRQIRERVRRTFANPPDEGMNIAAAVNINSPDRHTAVYSDDDVTIVHRDGETEVVHHPRDETAR